MVVRAWLEDEASGQLRARLTRSMDIGTSQETVSSASTVQQVVNMVEGWLEDFIANSHN